MYPLPNHFERRVHTIHVQDSLFLMRLSRWCSSDCLPQQQLQLLQLLLHLGLCTQCSHELVCVCKTHWVSAHCYDPKLRLPITKSEQALSFTDTNAYLSISVHFTRSHWQVFWVQSRRSRWLVASAETGSLGRPSLRGGRAQAGTRPHCVDSRCRIRHGGVGACQR
jgi:hypothetical protein